MLLSQSFGARKPGRCQNDFSVSQALGSALSPQNCVLDSSLSHIFSFLSLSAHLGYLTIKFRADGYTAVTEEEQSSQSTARRYLTRLKLHFRVLKLVAHSSSCTLQTCLLTNSTSEFRVLAHKANLPVKKLHSDFKGQCALDFLHDANLPHSSSCKMQTCLGKSGEVLQVRAQNRVHASVKPVGSGNARASEILHEEQGFSRASRVCV